ncbi:hypothetical protein KCU77_g16868, partial [Aureobasidium melanogenum]
MADDTKIWQLLPLVPGLLDAYNTTNFVEFAVQYGCEPRHAPAIKKAYLEICNDIVFHYEKHMILSVYEGYNEVDFEQVAAKTGIQSAADAEEAVKSALYKGLDITEIKDAVLALQLANSEVCQWSDCSKTFLTPGDLFEHLKTHVGNKRTNDLISRCRWADCAFTASFRQHYIQHMYKHVTNMRDQKCPHCDKSYIRVQHLNEHIKRKHQPAAVTQEDAADDVGEEAMDESEG